MTDRRPRRPATVVEQRLANSLPVDAEQARCTQCGAIYLDYPDGRDAHLVVFGHHPGTEDS